MADTMMLTVDQVRQWRLEPMAIPLLRARFDAVCAAFVDLAASRATIAKQPLTPQELRLKKAIIAYVARHEVSPSYAEMIAALDLRSKENIHRMVTSMNRKGHLVKVAGRHRSLQIVP